MKALEIARKNRPDLIVLDLRLPEMDGYAVCKALKSNSDTESLPIVILTARAEPNERVHGLELGADDYVTKPFSPRELVLRVQALLRRSRSSAQNYVLEVAEFQVDRNNFDIRLEGRRLELTPIEFKLLAILIERRGRIQPRETLLNRAIYVTPVPQDIVLSAWQRSILEISRNLKSSLKTRPIAVPILKRFDGLVDIGARSARDPSVGGAKRDSSNVWDAVTKPPSSQARSFRIRSFRSKPGFEQCGSWRDKKVA